MDQRNAHLQADRVALLMKAAEATRKYAEQNPEPATQQDDAEYQPSVLHVYEPPR